MAEGHYYKSLTRKLVSFVMLVSITPLILIAGVVGYSFEYAYKEKVGVQRFARLRQMELDNYQIPRL